MGLFAVYKLSLASTDISAAKAVDILFSVLGKGYFMLHNILCSFITVHGPFDLVLHLVNTHVKPYKACKAWHARLANLNVL